MKNLYKLLTVAIVAAFTALAAPSPAQAGYYFDIINPNFTAATAVGNLPATCRIPAYDVTDGTAILIDCNSVQGLASSPIAGTFTTLSATGAVTLSSTLGVTGTSTLAGINATGTLALTGAETVSSTLGVSGVTTATGGLVSIVTNDFHTPFSTAITANPISYTAKGSCTVAAVNGGTCIPLAATTGRTLTVTGYDIIATGSAATCTGVLLEDTNGTPVVASTIAAAGLTSGTHNFAGASSNVLGVGYGAGSGLTAAKGVQIIVNGSGCTTTTAFNYEITYTIQ